MILILNAFLKPEFFPKLQTWVQPESYRKELLTRLKGIELRDLSISRGTFDWGVPVPDHHPEAMSAGAK